MTLPRWFVSLFWACLALAGLGGCAAKMAEAEAPARLVAETPQVQLAEGVPAPPPPPAPAAASPGADASRSLDAPAASGGAVGPKPDLVAQAQKPARAEKQQVATDVPTPVAGAAEKPVSLMLIYQAELVMGVFETTKAIDEVEKLALAAGGYLVVRNEQSITVRVPAEKFRPTLGSVMKVGDVLGRNVSVRDVTQEYYDLEIRLRNAEVVRQRLEQLLAKADKVEDALAVERQLERVAGELERLKGQLKLLRELVSFSTITVRFRPTGTEHLEKKFRLPFDWLEQLGLGKLLSL
jgi:hypothetical protein